MQLPLFALFIIIVLDDASDDLCHLYEVSAYFIEHNLLLHRLAGLIAIKAPLLMLACKLALIPPYAIMFPKLLAFLYVFFLHAHALDKCF